MTSSSIATGVAGFSATPALAPVARICSSVRSRWTARFLMDGDDIGSGLAECFDVTLGFDDHQMCVEGQRRERGADRR